MKLKNVGPMHPGGLWVGFFSYCRDHFAELAESVSAFQSGDLQPDANLGFQNFLQVVVKMFQKTAGPQYSRSRRLKHFHLGALLVGCATLSPCTWLATRRSLKRQWKINICGTTLFATTLLHPSLSLTMDVHQVYFLRSPTGRRSTVIVSSTTIYQSSSSSSKSSPSES